MARLTETVIDKAFSGGNPKRTTPTDPLAAKSDIGGFVNELFTDITVLDSDAELSEVITKVNEIIEALKG